jgi:cyclic pyranopterin phosphate synthase
MSPLTHLDTYQRPISYLRVSVTDRCNLRCAYCMPPEGVPSRSHDEILRYEEIETVVRAAAELGVSKVRLTGGEPLVRLGIVDLVRTLARVPGVDDLSMTTNGILLPRYAQALAEAGLRRVNVSLDSLRPERFRSITRRGELKDALAGIDAAWRAGLSPVKVNVVVIRGMNDDEVVDLARVTVGEAWHVRFIEWMPVGHGANGAGWHEQVVTGDEIRRRVESALGQLEPARVPVGGGPARYYRLANARGTVGLITPVSEHFCGQCNRLRLTADGQLRLCLLSDLEVDLRVPLRRGAGVAEVKALIQAGIERKPLQHHLSECQQAESRAMSEIGG